MKSQSGARWHARTTSRSTESCCSAQGRARYSAWARLSGAPLPGAEVIRRIDIQRQVGITPEANRPFLGSEQPRVAREAGFAKGKPAGGIGGQKNAVGARPGFVGDQGHGVGLASLYQT